MQQVTKSLKTLANCKAAQPIQLHVKLKCLFVGDIIKGGFIKNLILKCSYVRVFCCIVHLVN